MATEPGKAIADYKDGLRVVLLDHWPFQVICDHTAKTDRVVCSCSQATLAKGSTVGEAIGIWIEHVLEQAKPWEVP